MNIPVTINMPEELDRALKKQADDRLLSKSALIRMVLKEHVDSTLSPETYDALSPGRNQSLEPKHD